MKKLLLATLLFGTASGWSADILYISPAGSDSAAGSREEPLQSLRAAVARLNESGGTVRLLSGTYKDSVTLPAAKSEEKLIIEAAEGEVPLFDGGETLTGWQPLDAGLYTAKGAFVNLWDPARRLRYLKEIDEAGVRAWPGSFVAREDGNILAHTPDGQPPATLRGNRAVVALDVQRSHTLIRGLRFQDYLGDRAATAILVTNATDVEVSGCTITHAIRGVAGERTAKELRVRDCVITDVACGVSFGGVGLEVSNCLLLAAAGDYAIREEVDYDLFNGIRFYHPAEKGTVRGCITAGFWTGLYQKTSSGRQGPLPFLCEGNLFLDGVQSVTSIQKGNRYTGNLIYGGILNLTRSEGKGARVDENYIFHTAKQNIRTHGEGNRLGRLPVVDLPGGDLKPRPEAELPAAAYSALERLGKRPVAWTPEIQALLAARFEPPAAASALALSEPLLRTSSARGALVVARTNKPVTGVLKVREAGGKGEWKEFPGRESRLSSAPALAAFENVTDVEDDEEMPQRFTTSFPLLGGALAPGKEYEYEITLRYGMGERLELPPGRFRTDGGPREIAVARDGLQQALDTALPGDTLVLAEGVHTMPAVLSHGGEADAPITIRGAASTGRPTILDGGRRCHALLELHRAPHVVVENLEMRYFERAGLVALESERLTVRGCRFLNKALTHHGFTKGTGVMLRQSPGATVRECLFTRLLYGVQANESPRLTLTHNTAFKNLFAGALLRQSARDSRVTHNSFTFTGNISFYIIENDKAAFASMVCDYNNYATTIRPIGETAARAYADAAVELPAEMESIAAPPARYGPLSGSKRIIDFIPDGSESRQRFFSMAAWRAFSGKDIHSIYADPAYRDPLKGDFTPLPDSPNRLPDVTLGAMN